MARYVHSKHPERESKGIYTASSVFGGTLGSTNHVFVTTFKTKFVCIAPETGKGTSSIVSYA